MLGDPCGGGCAFGSGSDSDDDDGADEGGPRYQMQNALAGSSSAVARQRPSGGQRSEGRHGDSFSSSSGVGDFMRLMPQCAGDATRATTSSCSTAHHEDLLPMTTGGGSTSRSGKEPRPPEASLGAWRQGRDSATSRYLSSKMASDASTVSPLIPGEGGNFSPQGGAKSDQFEDGDYEDDDASRTSQATLSSPPLELVTPQRLAGSTQFDSSKPAAQDGTVAE